MWKLASSLTESVTHFQSADDLPHQKSLFLENGNEIALQAISPTTTHTVLHTKMTKKHNFSFFFFFKLNNLWTS